MVCLIDEICAVFSELRPEIRLAKEILANLSIC